MTDPTPPTPTDPSGPDPSHGLEADQLTSALAAPLPRARLAPALVAAIWTVRILLLVLTGLVVAVFVHGL